MIWDLLNMKNNSEMVHDPWATCTPDGCKFLVHTSLLPFRALGGPTLCRAESVHNMFRMPVVFLASENISMLVLFPRKSMNPEH